MQKLTIFSSTIADSNRAWPLVKSMLFIHFICSMSVERINCHQHSQWTKVFFHFLWHPPPEHGHVEESQSCRNVILHGLTEDRKFVTQRGWVKWGLSIGPPSYRCNQEIFSSIKYHSRSNLGLNCPMSGKIGPDGLSGHGRSSFLP